MKQFSKLGNHVLEQLVAHVEPKALELVKERHANMLAAYRDLEELQKILDVQGTPDAVCARVKNFIDNRPEWISEEALQEAQILAGTIKGLNSIGSEQPILSSFFREFATVIVPPFIPIYHLAEILLGKPLSVLCADYYRAATEEKHLPLKELQSFVDTALSNYREDIATLNFYL